MPMPIIPRPEAELIDFQKSALVIDIHVHQKDFLSPVAKRIARLVMRDALPEFMPLSKAREGYVDGCVVAMIGDFLLVFPPTTEKRQKLARKQFLLIKKEVEAGGGVMVDHSADLLRAYENQTPFFVPAVEGADLLAGGLGFLEELRVWGTRVMSLVHFHKNAFGTVNATALQYWGNGKKAKMPRGLTSAGESLVRELNRLGIIVDLAHADRETIRDVTALSRHPVIVSHSGARQLYDFHRYLTDEEIRMIAGTGGVIGLWPMYYRNKGMKTPKEFSDHARYIVDIAGEDHLAVGTDTMGVPGFMEGYRGLQDSPVITAALFEAGLTENQVRKALGENFLRVLKAAETPG